jgi:hypothetical protein
VGRFDSGSDEEIPNRARTKSIRKTGREDAAAAWARFNHGRGGAARTFGKLGEPAYELEHSSGATAVRFFVIVYRKCTKILASVLSFQE